MFKGGRSPNHLNANGIRSSRSLSRNSGSSSTKNGNYHIGNGSYVPLDKRKQVRNMSDQTEFSALWHYLVNLGLGEK